MGCWSIYLHHEAHENAKWWSNVNQDSVTALHISHHKKHFTVLFWCNLTAIFKFIDYANLFLNENRPSTTQCARVSQFWSHVSLIRLVAGLLNCVHVQNVTWESKYYWQAPDQNALLSILRMCTWLLTVEFSFIIDQSWRPDNPLYLSLMSTSHTASQKSMKNEFPVRLVASFHSTWKETEARSEYPDTWNNLRRFHVGT